MVRVSLIATGVIASTAIVMALTGRGEDGQKRGSGGRAPAAVGGPPTIEPTATKRVGVRGPDPTVIASGHAPDGDPFEVVAFGTDEGACLVQMLPHSPQREAGGYCGRSVIPDHTGSIVQTGLATEAGSARIVDGFLGKNAATAEVAYVGSNDALVDAPTTIEPVSARLRRVLGSDEPISYFIAFVPADSGSPEITVTALDADGERLALQRVNNPVNFTVPDVVASGDLEPGRQVAGQTGCLACHMFGESGNPGPGPDLTSVGARLSEAEIAKALESGPGVMPSYADLRKNAPGDFDDLVLFLASLD